MQRDDDAAALQRARFHLAVARRGRRDRTAALDREQPGTHRGVTHEGVAGHGSPGLLRVTERGAETKPDRLRQLRA